jgi:hypothetical protein
MRKALTEIQQIEQYLQGMLKGAPLLLFRARLTTSASLREQVRLQRRVMQLLKYAGRQSRREQLERLHAQLMEDAAFKHTINAIFK